MKLVISILSHQLLLAFTLLLSFNSCEAQIKNLSSDINLVASIPGEEQIKSFLAIPLNTRVDFIRWNLSLTNTKTSKQTFTLNINYGEAQPNTLGFKMA